MTLGILPLKPSCTSAAGHHQRPPLVRRGLDGLVLCGVASHRCVHMLTVQPFIGGWHSLYSVDWAVTTAALIAPFVPCILVGQPTCITILNAPWCVGDAPPPAGVLAAPTDGVLGLCMHAWCDVVTNQGSRGVIVLSLAAVALRGLVLSRLEGRVRSDRGTIREVEHSSFVLTVPALTLRLCPVSARPHTLPRVCWAC